MLLEALLTDELVEAARPQRGLFRFFDRIGARAQQLLAAHRAPTDRNFSASRKSSSTDPSSGSCASTVRSSSGE